MLIVGKRGPRGDTQSADSANCAESGRQEGDARAGDDHWTVEQGWYGMYVGVAPDEPRRAGGNVESDVTLALTRGAGTR
jgi:hypothetical protein